MQRETTVTVYNAMQDQSFTMPVRLESDQWISKKLVAEHNDLLGSYVLDRTIESVQHWDNDPLRAAEPGRGDAEDL